MTQTMKAKYGNSGEDDTAAKGIDPEMECFGIKRK
eukprot:CAMPEP_0172495624 /NCGR_PEP_ID=MMETSP1066-20121228/73029_1 /TAXON_ID=671091 /ORGANISM="Coscinodiscus wailesii, Strain CCMP2513" /LENGTH=34 /DNA_ID= /DNA_START= /DNA_END= /DNA_ORIENTATION=